VIARLRELGVVGIRKMAGVEETIRFPLPLGLGDKSMAEVAAARS
jgi:4-hydroxy-3-methylbut-2-en-1-yl diphosphate reductase